MPLFILKTVVAMLIDEFGRDVYRWTKKRLIKRKIRTLPGRFASQVTRLWS